MTENIINRLCDELSFHHIGIAVESIAKSLEHYSILFGKKNISEINYISSQKVKVCFIKNGNSSYIELVEPTDAESGIFKLLRKKQSYYHVAYKVDNIHRVINLLKELNYKVLPEFASEAFGGKLCVFLYSPDAHLIELIEN